jgi:hypothetical protein
MKGTKRYSIIAVAILASILVISAASASGVDFTGFFKAFDTTLSPGEHYERNITVRQYYNVTVRFRKENSSSDLGFTSNTTIIVLKDSNGSQVLNITGVEKGKLYVKMDNYELGSVSTISAYNISGYEDVIDQSVDESTLSFIGSRAYITVVVKEPSKEHSTILGYVIDDLTGKMVSEVSIYAFENNADVNTSDYIEKGVSDENGKYLMDFELGENKALDIYVEGYDVV